MQAPGQRTVVTLEPAIKGLEKGTFVLRRGMKAQLFPAELEPGLLPAYFVKAYYHTLRHGAIAGFAGENSSLHPL